jgi:hypothetical protein
MAADSGWVEGGRWQVVHTMPEGWTVYTVSNTVVFEPWGLDRIVGMGLAVEGVEGPRPSSARWKSV